MEQIGRRIAYVPFGLVPACLGCAFAFFLGQLMLLALGGTLGLFIATAAEFPVQGKRYVIFVTLLVCGLVLALPLGVVFAASLVKARLTSADIPAALLVIWVFFCPSACAIHAIRSSRRTPNNSFKPSPLRGLGKWPLLFSHLPWPLRGPA